jgi:hypothetical protein
MATAPDASAADKTSCRPTQRGAEGAPRPGACSAVNAAAKSKCGEQTQRVAARAAGRAGTAAGSAQWSPSTASEGATKVPTRTAPGAKRLAADAVGNPKLRAAPKVALWRAKPAVAA